MLVNGEYVHPKKNVQWWNHDYLGQCLCSSFYGFVQHQWDPIHLQYIRVAAEVEDM